MKKRYIKISYKKFRDYYAYSLDDNRGDLKQFSVLEIFIGYSNPDYYLEAIREGRFGSGSDYAEVNWSVRTNSVIINLTSDISDSNEEFFVMRFDDFKKMIEDWVVLKKKKVLEIYFIINDQRQVFVNDKLEEV